MTISDRKTYEVEVSDLEYIRHGDRSIQATLYRPVGTGPFPIMVEVHGGAWVRGSRQNGDAPNRALAEYGIIVAAVDFTVPPDGPYPASFADIHFAIRWCKSQAASWNGRGDTIGAMGTSSGAHHAMLLGMRPNDPRYAALPGAAGVDGTLGCVIMVSPVIDPLGRYNYVKGLREDCTPPPGMVDRIAPAHEMYFGTEEAMAEASPGTALANGEKMALPPTLCVVRAHEAAHPRPDLEEFVSQYRKAGGDIDLTVYEGEGEGLLSDPSTPTAQQALDKMSAFIHQHLG